MIEIKENQELVLRKVISFRGKFEQTELEKVGKEMESYIKNVGAKKLGNPVTATYAVNGRLMDVEIIIPIDMKIKSSEKYTYREQLKIINAVEMLYKGHPIGLEDACNQLNQYIIEHNLHPITVGYNVTKNVDIMNLENTEIDVYVGINPNIV